MVSGSSRLWHTLKIKFLWQLPRESRKKIKTFLKMGDHYLSKGDQQLANYCYELARDLAEESDAIHLLKKINQRLQ